MKTTPLLLLGSLLVPGTVSFAGEPVQIDKNFSFRLDPPLPPEFSGSAPLPFPPPRSEPTPRALLKTPEGEPLPPGARAFRFNGRTYYRIPLGN